jgi:hypothetical protein
MRLMVGTGSEIRQPLGYTIVGGLLLSQLLTLYTTPAVYLYLDRFRVWVSSFRHSAGEISERRACGVNARFGSNRSEVLKTHFNGSDFAAHLDHDYRFQT